MPNVSEILDNKGAMVLSVDINESVLDAINLMAQVNIGAVLVQEGDIISGIFTERDYLQKIALKEETGENAGARTGGRLKFGALNTRRVGGKLWEWEWEMPTFRARNASIANAP